jgi:hypothetical protein
VSALKKASVAGDPAFELREPTTSLRHGSCGLFAFYGPIAGCHRYAPCASCRRRSPEGRGGEAGSFD